MLSLAVMVLVAPADVYWYADGVGLVEFVKGGWGIPAAGPYTLSVVVVENSTATWGAVKSLFH